MVAPIKNLRMDVRDIVDVVTRKKTVADAVNMIITRHRESIRGTIERFRR